MYTIGLDYKIMQMGIYVSFKLNDIRLIFIDLPSMHLMDEHLPHAEPHPNSNTEGLNLMTCLDAVTCTPSLSLLSKPGEREAGRFILPIFKNIFIAMSL